MDGQAGAMRVQEERTLRTAQESNDGGPLPAREAQRVAVRRGWVQADAGRSTGMNGREKGALSRGAGF